MASSFIFPARDEQKVIHLVVVKHSFFYLFVDTYIC